MAKTTVNYEDLPEYIGRFKVNRSLTQAFDYEKYGYWLIYRDLDRGLFAYNEDLDEEADLYTWILSVEEFEADSNIRQLWISYIDIKINELKNLGVINE